MARRSGNPNWVKKLPKCPVCGSGMMENRCYRCLDRTSIPTNWDAVPEPEHQRLMKEYRAKTKLEQLEELLKKKSKE